MAKLFDYAIELVTKHVISKVNVFCSAYAIAQTVWRKFNMASRRCFNISQVSDRNRGAEVTCSDRSRGFC